MSTPNVGGSPSEGAYRYETVYAFFPEHVVRQAERQVRRVRFQMSSKSFYADGRREEHRILRQALCRVPDSDRAVRLLRTRLGKFPAPDGPVGSRPLGLLGRSEARGLFGSEEQPLGTKRKECIDKTTKCDCWNPDPLTVICDCEEVCERYVYIDDGGGGDGGDGGETGSDPDPCSTDGDGTDQLCGPGGEVDTEVDDPCDLSDPPDYCDEAGSCFGEDIANSTHEAILEGLENQGAIADRWEDTNADVSDQDKRAERNSFIIQEDGKYRTEPFSEYGNITTTSCTIRGNVNVPSNAVGVLHFQPFSNGERITSRECLEAQDFANPDRFLGPDANYTIDYDSEPSDADKAMAKQYGLDTYVMDKDNITVVSKEGTTEGAYSRCGY